MDDLRVERVLRAVERIPEGRVATYGLIGRVVGESARVVGYVMARWGSNVPWWRVVNAQGVIPGHEQEARPHWEREGLLAGSRVRLAESLVDEDTLGHDWARATRDLPGD